LMRPRQRASPSATQGFRFVAVSTCGSLSIQEASPKQPLLASRPPMLRDLSQQFYPTRALVRVNETATRRRQILARGDATVVTTRTTGPARSFATARPSVWCAPIRRAVRREPSAAELAKSLIDGINSPLYGDRSPTAVSKRMMYVRCL
jgi:hypothetical protein